MPNRRAQDTAGEPQEMVNESRHAMLEIDDRYSIRLTEFDFTFSRSSGPGGQNVNKVNTKVTLHWSLRSTHSLPPDVLQRLREKYRRRINHHDQLVLYSQRFRDRGRNVADCLAKLRNLILEVLTPPVPRKATRVSRAAKARRLRQKRLQSEKKRRRLPPAE